MDTLTKVLIGVGVVAAGITVVGVYEHYKAPSAPAVLTGSPSVTLTPGTMSNVILSYTGKGTYTISPPTGGSFATTQTAVSSNNPAVINPTGSGAPMTLTPLAQGQATLTINWVDASNNPQTSTVLITVQS